MEDNNEVNIIHLEMDLDNDNDCCKYLRVKGVPFILYYKNGELNQTMVGYNKLKLYKLFKYIDNDINQDMKKAKT